MRHDFAEIQAMQSRARRERAEAVHRLIVAPFAALVSLPFKLARHAPRPRLARQG